jgi:hypothetical protein
VALSRAEVDQQIATARALPRSIHHAVQNIMTLATIDTESAEECIYALPRAGKAITGPSIRLAEIISSQWGNCRVGARVVHVDRFEKYVEAEGVFHDLETNTATTARVRRRISDKHGKLLNEDMIVVTGNAACSIAKRNAILGGVPKAVWRKAYAAVEQVLAGDVKTLAERRDAAMKAFAAFGVAPEQIFEALGIGGLDDITLEHLATLTGMRSALKNNEADVEEMFPKKQVETAKPKTMGDKLDALAASGKAQGKTETGAGDQAPQEGAGGSAAVQQAATPSDEKPADDKAGAKPLAEGQGDQGAPAASADAGPSPRPAAAVPAGDGAAGGGAPDAARTAAPPADSELPKLSVDEKKRLKRFAEAQGVAMQPKTLEKGFAAFTVDQALEEGQPLMAAARAVFEINKKRVAAAATSADVDNLVSRLLA